jgi:carotenoid 1,2-hydratase
VFSPYYHWAHRRALARGEVGADADDHVCLNVALYSPGARRWTMTERSRARLSRGARALSIGPSSLAWDGDTLAIDVDERASPLPRRVHGRIRVMPHALCRFDAALDAAGRHRWGPIAPAARVEVSLDAPALRWSGHAYFDTNEGDEPIAGAFADWDWLRATLDDGSTVVVYDVRPRNGAPDRVIAARFAPDGSASTFDAPTRESLPTTAWRIRRAARSEAGAGPPRLLRTLEDTPFYARSLLQSTLCGQRVVSVHESLDLGRLSSPAVRVLLPFRMPRLA